MASLNTDEDPVVDVLVKLKSGRRPAATMITQAELVYAKLKKELQLYKDEIIEIKKVKNVEVPKEEPVHEQPNGTEMYKMMEASARHTAENEDLKKELKSAKSEKEHLAKQIDDLKEQIERLEANPCKENSSCDKMNKSDDKLEDVHSKMNDSHDKENSLRDIMPERENKMSDEEHKTHVKEEHPKNVDKAGEVHSETNGSHESENDFREKKNDVQDHIVDVHNTTNCLNDEKNDTISKNKDKEGEDTCDWSKILQDKEKDLHDMKNRLHHLEEDLNKQKEENRRLQLKVTNLNQDLKLQQKLTIDKERNVQTLEDDLKILKNENNGFKFENTRLKTEIDSLNHLRKEAAQKNDKERQVQELKDDLNNLTDENNKLKSETTRLRTEIDSLNNLRKELAHKEIEKEVHTVAVFGNNILEENRKLKSENEHLRGELKYANEKVHRHSKQINEFAVKRENSRQNDDLKSEMNELRIENIKLQQDVKKLLQKVEDAKHNHEIYINYDYEERSYSNDQLPRLDGVNKREIRELQEENKILKHNVKQLKQDVAYAKHDRDQQRKLEESSHRKALKYKEVNKMLMQERDGLNEKKASLERDLQRAKDKLDLKLGERNKDTENRHAMKFGDNGYSIHKEYGFPNGHYMKLESELKATKEQLQRLLEERKRDEQKTYRDEIYNLKKDLGKLEHVNIKLERELKIAQAKLQHAQEERDRHKLSPAKSIEEEYSEHLGKERQHRRKRGLDSESRSTKDTMRKLSESSYDKRENDSERQRVEDFRRIIERQKDQIKLLSTENKTLQNDVHEVRNRLSVLAGHKLTTDNPNIADLSDGYRPTNIAEQFREVYDNEWTQAYEELVEKLHNDERKIIDTLVSILKKVEAFCVEASSHQFVSIKAAIENELTYPKYKLENGTVMAGKHRAEMSSSQKDTEDKFLKDLRKSLGILSTGPLAQIFHEVYMTKEVGTGGASAGLKTFVVQSVKLVWMMKMQTPPMGLIWADPKQNVDRNRFTFYTKRGDVIKQCVWPALELHKNGPLMSKGIVQAM